MNKVFLFLLMKKMLEFFISLEATSIIIILVTTGITFLPILIEINLAQVFSHFDFSFKNKCCLLSTKYLFFFKYTSNVFIEKTVNLSEI